MVDPWLGSGTTGYMAVKLGRRFAGFDLVSDYVEDAKQWLKETRQEVNANA